MPPSWPSILVWEWVWYLLDLCDAYCYTVITTVTFFSDSVFAGNLINSECFHLANQDSVSWKPSETDFLCRHLSLFSYCDCLAKGLPEDSIFLSLHLTPFAFGLGLVMSILSVRAWNSQLLLFFLFQDLGCVLHLWKCLSLGVSTGSTCNWISSTCYITLLPQQAQKVCLKSQGVKLQAECCGGTAVLLPSAEQAGS